MTTKTARLIIIGVYALIATALNIASAATTGSLQLIGFLFGMATIALFISMLWVENNQLRAHDFWQKEIEKNWFSMHRGRRLHDLSQAYLRGTIVTLEGLSRDGKLKILKYHPTDDSEENEEVLWMTRDDGRKMLIGNKYVVCASNAGFTLVNYFDEDSEDAKAVAIPVC